MARKVTRTTTNYDVTVERREGKPVAVIVIETNEILEDGRGYAGQRAAGLEVVVVPLGSLSKLVDQIVGTLTYDMTADPEERYNLTTDAIRRIGLYSPLDHHTPVNTFYTVAEARVALRTCASGYVIAHLPEEGEDFRSVIEVNQ